MKRKMLQTKLTAVFTGTLLLVPLAAVLRLTAHPDAGAAFLPRTRPAEITARDVH